MQVLMNKIEVLKLVLLLVIAFSTFISEGMCWNPAGYPGGKSRRISERVSIVIRMNHRMDNHVDIHVGIENGYVWIRRWL
jgi:hypothetical protein